MSLSKKLNTLFFVLFFLTAGCGSEIHDENTSKPAAEAEVLPAETATDEEASSASRSDLESADLSNSQEVFQQRKLRIFNALAQSHLYLLLHRLMYAASSRIEEEQLTRQIRDRIFEKDKSAITAISAVHFLIQEFDQRSELDQDQVRRLLLLQSSIFQRQQDQASYPGEGLAYFASVAFITALPLGYPPIRHALKNVVNFLARQLPLLGRRRPWQPFEPVSPLLNGARTYNLTATLQNYFQVFGPASMLYFFWFDWKESARGQSIDSVTDIRSESLVTEESFIDFLEDLKKL